MPTLPYPLASEGCCGSNLRRVATPETESSSDHPESTSRDSQFHLEAPLVGALAEFAGTLTGRYEVSEVLYRLAEHVMKILAVAGCGVSVTDEEGRLRPVTGVNELTTELEAVEEEHQEGPCVDAFQRGELVVVDDLAGQGDWPGWSAEAARHGVGAVLGVPLRAFDRTIGAMNIYATGARRWHKVEIQVAETLTNMAASYVANASELEQSRRTAEQLQEALDSRVIIEQAKGVLAAEMHLSVERAFEILRRHSQRHGVSLRTVADAVVNLELRPKAD